ncbi:acid protease, partial [Auriculariales sp. MPI-PUGE-AT-0066]
MACPCAARVVVTLAVVALAVTAVPVDSSLPRQQGFAQIPLIHTSAHSRLARRQSNVSYAGLGDAYDITYNVLVQVGPVRMPVVLDTGSSDLWVISDACLSDACVAAVGDTWPPYPMDNLSEETVPVHLEYGDSSARTTADGPGGTSTIGIAGLSLENQFFAAINDTDIRLADTGSTGILGLGFPLSSIVLADYFKKLRLASAKRDLRHSAVSHTTLSARDPAADLLATAGPFITRAILQNQFPEPMISVTLQRDSIDPGGNAGMLTLGGLPPTVQSDSLTWADVRLYSRTEWELPDSLPETHYPLAWEIMIDNVYLDGQKLPQTNITNSSLGISALLDTGYSWISGPADVVDIAKRRILAPGSASDQVIPSTYDCQPHSLAFEIGGKLFTVDPRDLVSQNSETEASNATICSLNLAARRSPDTDHGFLYSWKLGAPFLRSVLSAYYYGDLVNPSQDRPRIGLLSTVPTDANEAMIDAIALAESSGGNFPLLSEDAPTATYSSLAIAANGVPLAPSIHPTTSVHQRPPNDAVRIRTSRSALVSVACLCAFWTL